MAAADASRAVVERTVRDHWGYLLAALVGQVRDLELAEDVLQDAAVAALEHWPADGLPDNPRAWLVQTARRRAIDRFRREARFREKRDQLERWFEAHAREDEPGGDEAVIDQRLSLMFTCCHPALDDPAQVALTLRTLGGLTTTEIAHAFLVPEATMAQRLVRAKRKIRLAGIPYGVPAPHLWHERLGSVLAVVYFIFNEGYSATSGAGPVRAELCDEAIRLGRMLQALAPDEPEAAGLLALMLLHDSRRGARTAGAGAMVTLEDQDRGLWDRESIDEGDRILRAALGRGRAGPYQVQAAISAVHATAPSYAATDWRQIAGLYAKLHALQPSPVVRLNEIVARSFADGAGAALAELDELGRVKLMERYQPFHAARADLLRRAGRIDEARAAYATALELTDNAAERGFLRRRLDSLGSDASRE
jgi:RNA polymerase sigma-70 factor (ECF subfamily)